jgi:hypothetical protein
MRILSIDNDWRYRCVNHVRLPFGTPTCFIWQDKRQRLSTRNLDVLPRGRGHQRCLARSA